MGSFEVAADKQSEKKKKEKLLPTTEALMTTVKMANA